MIITIAVKVTRVSKVQQKLTKLLNIFFTIITGIEEEKLSGNG
jgi:hypothetical protein